MDVRALQRRFDVRGGCACLWRRGIPQFEIEHLDGRIEVGADDAAELILGLYESVFGLNDADTTGSDLRFRAIDVQWRKCAKGESSFLVVVGALGGIERFFLDSEVFAGAHDVPIFLYG